MNVTQVIIIAAAVIYFIARRFAGAPVGSRSLLIPLGLMIFGVTQLHLPLTLTDIALLLVELVLGVLAGIGRGYTIRLYVRDGHLWQKYQLTTLAVWLALIAVRVGFAVGAYSVGATVSAGAAGLLMFGLSLLVESFVVAHRAAATGTPLLPRAPRRRDVAGVR